jgi:hypothetical protein
MTYPSSPVNEPTFIVITSAGLLALLAAAVLTLVQPTDASHSVTAAQAVDVSTTGTVVQTTREWTDPVRLNAAVHYDMLLVTASD